MLRLLITFSFLVLSLGTFAQGIQLSTQNIDFGDVFEDVTDSLQVMVSNPSQTDTVKVTDLVFYEIYGNEDFSTIDSTFALPPGGSHTIWVKFNPRHNIAYLSQMVLLDDAHLGSSVVELKGNGKYRKTYYSSTFNLEEEALKSALKSRLSQGYVQLSYAVARDYMFMNIDNQKVNGLGASQNTLECVYTGRTVVGYSDRQDAQNSFIDKFNTEHTYPRSQFSNAFPMQSDIHHLFPTWDMANTQRSNHPFANVTGTPSWQDGGSVRVGSKFEPRDKHKGGVARAMMYFVIRYQNYSGFFTSQETVLRQWHKTFPPDSVGMRRNDDVQTYQGNRNPFVDYPQFVDRITSISNTSTAPENYWLDQPEAAIDYGMIQALVPVVYHYSLVNHGNQALSLSNLSLTSSELTFQNGTGANHTLQPGESRVIEVQLIGQQRGSLSDSLIFTLDDPRNTLVIVPIHAELSSATSIDRGAIDPEAPILAPTPSREVIGLHWPSQPKQAGKYYLLDVQGRIVLKGNFAAGQELDSIALDGISTGLYFLDLNWGGHHQQYKVVVE